MTPFFSIIVPTYNSEQLLEQCLRSICQQSFIDFEILMIDGLSNDETLQKAARLNDQRIRVYREADKGIYDAMNKGIRYARGEWIYFLGSDDSLYDNDVLMDVYRCASKRMRNVIYGNVLTHGDTRWSKDQEIYGGPFTLQRLLRRNICHQSIFYRRSFIQHYQLQFDLRYPVSADWEFNLQCRLLGKFYYLDRLIAHFLAGGASSVENSMDAFCHDVRIKYGSLYRNSNYPSVFSPLKKIYATLKTGWRDRT